MEGFVLESAALGDDRERPDAFKVGEYERVIATVRLDRVLDVDAFVYALTRNE